MGNYRKLSLAVKSFYPKKKRNPDNVNVQLKLKGQLEWNKEASVRMIRGWNPRKYDRT